MCPERTGGKPPYGDGVYRSKEKTQATWELKKDEIHPKSRRMFEYAKRITDEALKSETYIIIKEINAALHRVSQLLGEGKSITDQQLFIQAQVSRLVNIIDNFLNGKPAGYMKPLQDLKKYGEGTFSKYVMNLPVKK